ncbi:MAG: hypothetical protein VKK07_00245 [Merismopediaceae bacterium]|nr:hypothetical protein [Merismopediaceae bacterium]
MAQSTYTITGSLTLVDSKIEGSQTNCYGTGGYSDIEGGMEVTIRNDIGKIIAIGRTDAGYRQQGEYSSVTCIFPFKVTDIPRSPFYSIEIGRRGKVNFSYTELQKQKWKVNFSLSR